MNPPVPDQSRIETSLGPALVRDGDDLALDLGELPVMHGLSVLSRALSEMIVGQARSDRIDVSAERRLRPRENPELLEQFGIDLVKIAAEHGVVASIGAGPEAFERRLRALLGSLQRQRYRDALLPEDRSQTRALVAQFGDGASRVRFVLEFVPMHGSDRGGRSDRGFLRITIESCDGRRLDLSSIPHVLIEDVEERQFIAGSTRIAQTWTEAVRREAERGRRTWFEQRQPHSHLFRQIDQAGFEAVERVAIHWTEDAVAQLLASDPDEVSGTLKRVLLALEDRSVRRVLGERGVVRVDGGLIPIHVDLSQLGRMLCLSLGGRRQRSEVDAFLARMPAVGRSIAASVPAKPLAGVSVFLVHHITAEIVGVIAALRRLGCTDLVCQFVTYAGEPPASYLDALLDLPAHEFLAFALASVPRKGHVEGQYRLSTQYSKMPGAEAIQRALIGRDGSYLAAMRTAAIGPWIAMMQRATASGRRCLLIEDGGYLGPILNDAALSGHSVRDFAAEYGYAVDDDSSMRAAFVERFLGSVEHTRNGFDRLAEVERAHGRLALPAMSIAISRLKREVESREVAASILNAVETVLNADGRILARRSCLVLGSHGAIGNWLVRSLTSRLDEPSAQLAQIDLVVDEASAPAAQARTLSGLGDSAWLASDLVIGVTGDSVLKGPDVERWLLGSPHRDLVLVSGSTKTVEFRDVMAWIDGLLNSAAATIGDERVEVRSAEILDPRTQRVYGHRYSFHFAGDSENPHGAPREPRSISCLANLTPINFMFYGVATELIDEVLAQLLECSLAILSVGRELPPRLLAVDRDIDARGRRSNHAPTD
ncbi:MAG: hypothetical protein AB7T19_05650 [Planctomycetota bacterium]